MEGYNDNSTSQSPEQGDAPDFDMEQLVVGYMHELAQTKDQELSAQPEVRHRIEGRIARAIGHLGRYIAAVQAEPENHFLRSAQIPVFESTLHALQEEGANLKGYYSLPTGSGKSVIYTELVKLFDMSTLIVTPKQHLVDDIAHTFATFLLPHEQPVRMGKIYSGKKETDQQVTGITYASLIQQTLRVPHLNHTGPLGTHDRAQGRLRGDQLDLLVLDEAHNTLGRRTREALGWYDHTVQLGFTATENYSDQRKLSSLLPTEIHKLSVLEACSLNLIAPYSNWVLNTGLDISNIRIKRNKEYDADELQAQINSPERNALIVNLYKEVLNNQKTFIFCSGVEHALDLSLMLNRQGIYAAAMHGKQSSAEHREVLRSARRRDSDSVQVICSDRLLIEGTDLDNFAACINAVPVLGSYVRAQQRGGRCLRLDPLNPKKQAIIIDVVDQDYRTAPLLFCHPQIGQTAAVGNRDATPTQTIPYGDNRQAYLITDPAIVEQLDKTYDDRRPKPPTPLLPPPEGWHSIIDLAKAWDIETATLWYRVRTYRKLATIPDYKAHTGRFRSEDAPRGSFFLSPDFSKGLSQWWQRTEEAQQDDKPPEYWMNIAQIEAWYGLTSSQRMQLMSRSGDSARLCVPHYTKAKTKYFSPETVEAYITSIGKTYIPPDDTPPDWKVLRSREQAFCTDEDEQFAQEILLWQDKSLYNHFINRDGIWYYSPWFHTLLSQKLERASSWYTLEETATELGMTSAELKQKIYKDIDQKQYRLKNDWLPDMSGAHGGGLISPMLYASLRAEQER